MEVTLAALLARPAPLPSLFGPPSPFSLCTGSSSYCEADYAQLEAFFSGHSLTGACRTQHASGAQRARLGEPAAGQRMSPHLTVRSSVPRRPRGARRPLRHELRHAHGGGCKDGGASSGRGSAIADSHTRMNTRRQPPRAPPRTRRPQAATRRRRTPRRRAVPRAPGAPRRDTRVYTRVFVIVG